MKTIKLSLNASTFAPQEFDVRPNARAWAEDFPSASPASGAAFVICSNCDQHIDTDEIDDSFCPNCNVFADWNHIDWR